MDPAIIPLGSMVEVRFGDGTTKVYEALDTGGAIKGRHIDIYDRSVAQCFKTADSGWKLGY